MRYFSENELISLLSLGDTKSSAIMTELNELHPGKLSYTDLEQHIEIISSLKDVVGISHHDQLHTKHVPKTQLTEEELKLAPQAPGRFKQPKIKGFRIEPVTNEVSVEQLAANFTDLSISPKN
jgi:hypothetical protein